MLLLLATCFFFSSVCAQDKKKDSVAQKDVGDVLRKLFGKKADSTQPPKEGKGLAILPTLSYNPSFGFMIGAKISGGKQFGNPDDTEYSIFGLEG